jgi:hypothetical protein
MFAGGNAWKVNIRLDNIIRKYRVIHKPNKPAKGSGKWVQDIHGRCYPFREFIVAILGLIELGGLLSKDGEDSFGGMTGLKPGKERMLGEVLLSLTLVFFQSSVKNGGKVWMRGGGGRDSGHGVTARGEERERDSWRWGIDTKGGIDK